MTIMKNTKEWSTLKIYYEVVTENLETEHKILILAHYLHPGFEF